MIVFDLKCTCGGQFEGWFKSREDFEQQCLDNQVTCPYCGCDEIHKILSPVAVHTVPAHAAETIVPSPQQQPKITQETAIQFLRTVQDFIENNFEDVGPKLAEESLKIRYGVHEPRNIRGVATADEEKMLHKEGIELLKIPMIKKSSDSKPN